jgi:hypothetical protein
MNAQERARFEALEARVAQLEATLAPLLVEVPAPADPLTAAWESARAKFAAREGR